MSDILSTAKPILERFRLDGRTALVTGAASGIGRAYAHALGEAGAAVAVVDLNPQGSQLVVEELAAKGIQACAICIDVTQSQQVDQMVAELLKRWGKLDIAVNNAGIGQWAAAEEMSDADWAKVLNVNLNGVFYCCRAEGKAMLAAGYGKIINTASMSASIVNWPQKQAHYNTSKAAVVHLTHTLAVEWADRGVRVNCISPGYTRTKLLVDLAETPAGKVFVPQWTEQTPMKMMAEVTDLQGALVFLACEASDFMTGHDLIIDGGFSLW
jgi:NAD(P)-dependent dehydrogenase (short-subunit alcohol dehydrogenase family)